MVSQQSSGYFEWSAPVFGSPTDRSQRLSMNCNKEQTVYSSNASVVRNLISIWYTSLPVCVATRVSSTLPAVGVALFHPLCVRSSQPAVGTSLLSSFHPLWVRSFRCFDRPSRRSEPRSCITSLWSSCLVIIQSSSSVVFASLLASRKYSSLSVLRAA